MKLYKHQEETYSFAKNRNCVYADLSDCGTGKTISTINVFNKYCQAYRKNSGGLLNPKGLVLAPKSIIESSWAEDCQQFNNITTSSVIGSTSNKLSLLEEDSDLYITNYESVNNPKIYSKLESMRFHFLICDEAVRLKNHRAKWTKLITKLSLTIPYRVIISGLITPNNLMEIYSPFNILEPNLLGKSFWQFRSRYFNPDPFSYMNKSWLPKKNAHRDISNLINGMIVRHDKDKCLDLPEKIHTKRVVKMTSGQRKMYNEMKKQFIVSIKDVGAITALTASTHLNKLSQISSGFLYDEDKNTHFLESAKMKELRNLFEGELSSQQVIVFCSYKAEMDAFKHFFPNQAYIHGGMSDLALKDNIERFQKNKCRYLFANMKASKYGLTFTNCSNVIYYTLNYSLDDLYQSQERVHRIGQTKTCNYIYLLSEKSIDTRIYNAVMKKQSLNDFMMELIDDSDNI